MAEEGRVRKGRGGRTAEDGEGGGEGRGGEGPTSNATAEGRRKGVVVSWRCGGDGRPLARFKCLDPNYTQQRILDNHILY